LIENLKKYTRKVFLKKIYNFIECRQPLRLGNDYRIYYKKINGNIIE
jgi:hypothetical protein